MAKKPQKPGKSNESSKETARKPDPASGTSPGQPNVIPPATGQRNVPQGGQGRSEVF